MAEDDVLPITIPFRAEAPWRPKNPTPFHGMTIVVIDPAAGVIGRPD